MYESSYKGIITEYLEQLIGYTIIEVNVDVDQEDDSTEYWPYLIARKGKKVMQIDILRDPEGNGEGHLDIQDITHLNKE